MRAKFVVCSRKKSRRVPDKPFQKINGKPLIEHLLDRLVPISKPVYLAIPPDDVSAYSYLPEKYNFDVELFCGHADDPLKRMWECASANKIDHAIRVTHDKIFVRPEQVHAAVHAYMSRGLDYLYSSQFTPGTAFEIISQNALGVAKDAFEKVEHISYAIKATTQNVMDWRPQETADDARMLIDFPEDLDFMQVVMATMGNNTNYDDVMGLLNRFPWIKSLNKLPDITVYTCSLNNSGTVENCMDSVLTQKLPEGVTMEYVLVDDFSQDATTLKMAHAAATNDNVRYIRNNENLGLASSSNIALSHARGKYIVRLDADDYFSKKDALAKMYNEIETTRDIDVLYPCFYDGSMHKIGDPKENHHPAGAMFQTRALNHIKFTDKLRHYDGLDLYLRAKEQLKIGYYLTPLFYYTHRKGSLSRGDDPQRETTKLKIIDANGGNF